MKESSATQIRINVITAYIAEQSIPDQDRYVFSYTISITNNSDEPVKLLRRHWIITDANNKI